MKVIKVKSWAVHCEGEKGGSGHPRIYLTMRKDEKSVRCPYCGQKFEYAG